MYINGVILKMSNNDFSYSAASRLELMRKKEISIARNSWKIKIFTQNINNDSKVLDIGCACGCLSHFMPDKNNYYGLDYNKDFIDFCLSIGLNVLDYNINIGKLPYKDNMFDFVYCSHVIEHFETRIQHKIIKEIYRIIKPNGILFMAAPTPYHWYFWDENTHTRPCTHGQLEFMAKDHGFRYAEGKYSLFRWLPSKLHRWIRLPPIRWFLWETYLVAKK